MDRYYPVSLTVPPNTPLSVPVSQDVPLENNLLVDIEIQIPNGHSGFTGIRVLSSHQQILPWGNLSWIVADDYNRVFMWNEEIGASAISVQGYNTDSIEHTFYLRFHVVNLPVVAPATGVSGGSGDGGIVGITGGGGNPPVITPPAVPPVGVPTLPVPPVISPISGVGQPAQPAYNPTQEKLLLFTD